MRYYLYILKTIDEKLYCGIAKNPLERYQKHVLGLGAKYTKAHRPKEIVYIKIFEDKNSALKEEYRIKHTLSREKKFELIKKANFETKGILEGLREENN